MNVGDIMFIGSKHDRQEYGFAVVIPNTGKKGNTYFIGNDTERGPYGPLQDEVLPNIKSKVVYHDTFEKIEKWQKVNETRFMDELFFTGVDKEEIIEFYKEEKIWN